MLSLTTSLLLLVLAHVGSSALCGPKNPNLLNSGTLECSPSPTGVSGSCHFKLINSGLIKYVTLSTTKPSKLVLPNFTVNANSQVCSRLVPGRAQRDIFQISCAYGGVYGVAKSSIKFIKETPTSVGFGNYTIHVCGDGAPEIEISKRRAHQSSDECAEHGAADAIDKDQFSYSLTKKILSTNIEQRRPWWTVSLGEPYTIHYIEITNRVRDWNYLGNIVVTVDNQVCGELREGNRHYVIIECPTRPKGALLQIQLKEAPINGTLALAEVRVFGKVLQEGFRTMNIPKIELSGNNVQQSATDDYDKSSPELAIDGNPFTWSRTAFNATEIPSWTVELGKNGEAYYVYYVVISSPLNLWADLKRVMVTVDDLPCNYKPINPEKEQQQLWIDCRDIPAGRFLKILMEVPPTRKTYTADDDEVLTVFYDNQLTLAEVQVFGYKESN
eukprot:Ihof_evm1s893 gene=Ihof_evmTU1s893